MNAADIQIVATALCGLLVAMGGGASWVIKHIDAKQARSEVAQSIARDALSLRLHEEISSLRVELARMHTENKLYLRRILQLEAFIHTHPGLRAPAMEGWPPL